jgi:subtilase family serine protease
MKIRNLASLPLALTSCLLAQAAFPQSIVAVPKPMGTALRAGVPEPSMPMQVTVWLRLHDMQGLESTLEKLYDPSSPTYHEWLQAPDLARYAPTAADVATVKAQLQSHGLTVLADDPARLSVRAQGTVAQMESAFHTHIGSFTEGAATHYANTSAATLEAPAGNLALSVSGLDNTGSLPVSTVPLNADPFDRARQQSVAIAGQPQVTGGDLSKIITDRCFQPPQVFTLGTQGQLPFATYMGNAYNPGSLPCGFTVAQLTEAYGVTEAHARGLRGAGQTIVLMEFYDSPTILDDVQAFSRLNGLPTLNGSNFTVVYPDGRPTAPGPLDSSSVVQTPLDVEWAHAMAPEAKIVLMIMPTEGDEEVQFGISYAATQRLGGVLSVNFSTPELTAGTSTAQSYNQVVALAAAAGIAVNVSTGIWSSTQGKATPVGNPGLPAASPYATAVGGTSRGLPDGNGGFAESAFGLALLFLEATRIPEDILVPLLPSSTLGGEASTAGGESGFFTKPAYQAALPCSGRCVPDISALADPLTGGLVVVTDPATGQQVATSAGGTGLSAAIFSGIWALANQHAHHWLGQAAPAIARMPQRAFHDIVPVGSSTNVSGSFIDSTGTTTNFTSAEMFELLGPPPTEFVSAISQNTASAVAYGWGFGGLLTVTKGWDNMTGFGTPNGMAFIDAAAHERENKH